MTNFCRLSIIPFQETLKISFDSVHLEAKIYKTFQLAQVRHLTAATAAVRAWAFVHA